MGKEVCYQHSPTKQRMKKIHYIVNSVFRQCSRTFCSGQSFEIGKEREMQMEREREREWQGNGARDGESDRKRDKEGGGEREAGRKMLTRARQQSKRQIVKEKSNCKSWDSHNKDSFPNEATLWRRRGGREQRFTLHNLLNCYRVGSHTG